MEEGWREEIKGLEEHDNLLQGAPLLDRPVLDVLPPVHLRHRAIKALDHITETLFMLGCRIIIQIFNRLQIHVGALLI